MADITVRQDQQLPIATQIRYRDMGDGTYAKIGATEQVMRNPTSSITTPLLDPDLGAQVFVNEYEYALHRSWRFKATYLVPHGSEVTNDGSRDFLIRVQSEHAHMRISLSVGGNCELYLYEGPEVLGSGAQIAVLSKNRDPTGNPGTLVYHTPNLGLIGTLLGVWFVPGGSGPRATGGDWGDTHWILRANTDYAISVTNRSGGAIQFSLGLGWSEHRGD